MSIVTTSPFRNGWTRPIAVRLSVFLQNARLRERSEAKQMYVMILTHKYAIYRLIDHLDCFAKARKDGYGPRSTLLRREVFLTLTMNSVVKA